MIESNLTETTIAQFSFENIIKCLSDLELHFNESTLLRFLTGIYFCVNKHMQFSLVVFGVIKLPLRVVLK